jgi:hypothetical protein
MKKPAALGLAVLITITIWQSRALAIQSLTDIGSTSPTTTYEQPQHGLGGNASPNADAGIGEEFTLSLGDASMQLTDVIVKSSGGQNPVGSSGSIDWTLNLYDITDENKPGTHELIETFPGVSVTDGDFLDFTLSDADSAQASLVGGDTYAFTVTTSAPYILGGLLKSNETPPSYLPTGFSADELVTGNGSGSSLSIYDDPVNGEADLTFFLETEEIPEPQVFALLPLGALMLWGLRRRLKATTCVA